MSEPPSEGTGLTGRPLAGLLELTSGELSSGGRARLRGAPAEPRGGGGAPPPEEGGRRPPLSCAGGLASLGSGRATHATTAALLPPTDTRITGTTTSGGAGHTTTRERGPERRRLDVATGGRLGPKQSRRSRSAAVRGAPLARCAAGEGEGPRSPARINGAPLKSTSHSGPELRLNVTVPLAVPAQGRPLDGLRSSKCIVSDRHKCFTKAEKSFVPP
ncbi:hypothetical protein MTO96_022298 [Rhipicephalus appendiculatus]